MAEKRYKEINGVRYEVVPNPDMGSNLIPVEEFIEAPSTPSDGDFLVYDSSSSKWVAQSLSAWTAGSY